MDNDKLAFRTVAVGGFHKQDVVTYIQSLARLYTDQINQLKAQLATAQEACATEQGDPDETARLREMLDLQSLEVGRLQADLSTRTELLEQTRRDSAALKEQLDAARREADALRTDAANRQAAAENRARQAAQNAAAALGAECDAQLARIQSHYEQLRGNIEATVLRATDELERARAALTGAMTAFHDSGDTAD